MRDFFINAFEKLVGVVIVLLLIGVVIGAIGAAFAPSQPGQPSGILLSIAILLGGLIYVIFVGGALYLGLGIYQNTKRMAEALDRREP
jgi:small-conductance mechanosensitive channel